MVPTIFIQSLNHKSFTHVNLNYKKAQRSEKHEHTVNISIKNLLEIITAYNDIHQFQGLLPVKAEF